MATHTYSTPGSYTITQTVTGPGGTDTYTYPTQVVVSEAQSSGPPVFRSEATNHTNSSTSISATLPSGVVQGDLLVLILSQRAGNPTMSTPTGWSLVKAVKSTTESMSMFVYRRIAPATPSAPTLTSSSNMPMITQTLAFENGTFDTTYPFNTYVYKWYSGTGTASTTVPSIETSDDNTMQIAAAARLYAADYSVVLQPSSSPWVVDGIEYTTAASTNLAMLTQHRTRLTASTSTSTATISTNTGTNQWAGITLAVNPPGGSAPPRDPDDNTNTSGMPIMVGISRSIYGLNGSEDSKRAATKERMAQFAAQTGVTAEYMRSKSGRHVYYTGSNLPNNMNTIGIINSCGQDGYGNIMFTASRLVDRSGRAAGDWNEQIKTFLRSKHDTPALDKMMFMLNFDHEPSNDGDPWDAAQWCKVQAQAAKAVYELNDPTVYYTTCHIPSAADAKWSHINALKQIAPNNWQDITDRTYLGLDPYPEAENGNPPTFGTVWGRIDRAVSIYRNNGDTGPVCLPEVALFHYDDTGANSGPVPLSADGQAKRLHDNFCVELPPKCNLRAWWYFDVTDTNNARGDTRILDTAAEQKEYGYEILGTHDPRRGGSL